MEKIELEAKTRETAGKGLKVMRKQGLIPAVVYGKKMKAISLSIEEKRFVKTILRSEAGMNAIVTLKIAGEKGKAIPVLTQEVQRDPLTDQILHVDFRHISMDEAIKTKVHIELVGTPIGVKESGGVLVHGLREIEVECLPTNIPDKFEIDVSGLAINDSLHVSDLKTTAKVKILAIPTEMIANCSPPTKEEEVAAPVPTPEEVAAAAEGVVEGDKAVADEKVKEKSAPGAAPAKEAPAKAAPAPKAEKK
ncbi:MAG: 50S ribosomal protein L25 [Candidatus Margulisbacteria bacterium]|nr:50S ribosomal protein L25 [Candidatus Margulisiibacteriota bacterium]